MQKSLQNGGQIYLISLSALFETHKVSTVIGLQPRKHYLSGLQNKASESLVKKLGVNLGWPFIYEKNLSSTVVKSLDTVLLVIHVNYGIVEYMYMVQKKELQTDTYLYFVKYDKLWKT